MGGAHVRLIYMYFSWLNSAINMKVIVICQYWEGPYYQISYMFKLSIAINSWNSYGWLISSALGE